MRESFARAAYGTIYTMLAVIYHADRMMPLSWNLQSCRLRTELDLPSALTDETSEIWWETRLCLDNASHP